MTRQVPGVCQGQNTGYGSKEMWKVLTTSQRHLTGSPVCSTLQGCGNDLFWQVLQSYSCGSVRCFTGGNQQLSLRVGFSHSAFLTATLVIALKWVVIQQLWWQPGSTTLPAEEEKDASPWKCFISSWILFFAAVELANTVWKLSDCITVALSPSQYISLTWCSLHFKGLLLVCPCFSVCLW